MLYEIDVSKIISNDNFNIKSIFNTITPQNSFNSYQITDRDKTGNYGVDFSTLIKKLEKSNL
ncbi:hypothetical protein GLS27_24035 [Escherichia coli]|nr:hypothetical protein [Escherichia coli]